MNQPRPSRQSGSTVPVGAIVAIIGAIGAAVAGVVQVAPWRKPAPAPVTMPADKVATALPTPAPTIDDDSSAPESTDSTQDGPPSSVDGAESPAVP